MGNETQGTDQTPLMKQSSRLREAEMTDTESLGESLYEEREEDSNCFGCIKCKKTILKKIDWEYKFLRNCAEVVEEFEWARQLAEVVSSYDLPRAKFYREVAALKREKCVVSEADSRPSQKEMEAFRKNLKKSVIMSFSSKVVPPDTRQSVINVKKSRIETQRNKHLRSDIIPDRSPSSLSRDNFKRSFIGLDDAPTADSPAEITKSTTHELEVFMKFSNILEIHLNDPACVLGRVKAEFIRVMGRRYGDAEVASGVLGELVDDVKQFLLILKQAVVDYYSLGSFAEGGLNLLIANEENVLSSCTSILFKDHHFYSLIFNAVSHHFRHQETRFRHILEVLRGSGPERFSVKDKFCLNQRTLKAYISQMSAESGEGIVENIEIDQNPDAHNPFQRCQDSLHELAKSRSPVNKMKAIAACSEGITREIEAFYERNCLQKEKWMLDADQVLSIFAYIIVAARVEHLHTQLYLLDNFANGFQMINMTGYYMAVLNCAVEHLENEFAPLLPE